MGLNHPYHVLVVHPVDQSVLVLADKELPAISYDGFTATALDRLCGYVQTELNLPFGLILLRTECEAPIRSWYRHMLLIFEIPRNEVQRVPERCTWMPKIEVNDIRVEPPTSEVINYLHEYKVRGLDIHSDRLYPYSQLGWFDDASEWMKRILSEAGHDISSIRQVGNGPQSSMLVATNSSGFKFFMKAVQPGGMNDEVRVTCTLNEVMPEDFMKPLSFDAKRKWLVMSDYGKLLPDDDTLNEKDPELVRKVLSQWARIQKKSVDRARRLTEAGVPVLDGTCLRLKVKEMVEDPEWWTAQWEGMNTKQRKRYEKSEYKQKYLTYVEQLCKTVAKYKVPLALVHGDLETVNVLSRQNRPFVFIDFAFTRLSFPFADALRFARACGAETKDLDFYLEFWCEYESMDRLRELLAVVDDLDVVQCHLVLHQIYKTVEECGRCSARQDLGNPVCYAFDD